jgi:hypothetical protein
VLAQAKHGSYARNAISTRLSVPSVKGVRLAARADDEVLQVRDEDLLLG